MLHWATSWGTFSQTILFFGISYCWKLCVDINDSSNQSLEGHGVQIQIGSGAPWISSRTYLSLSCSCNDAQGYSLLSQFEPSSGIWEQLSLKMALYRRYSLRTHEFDCSKVIRYKFLISMFSQRGWSKLPWVDLGTYNSIILY